MVDTENNVLRGHLGTDLLTKHVPSISEIHTVTFPLYIDMDFKIPLRDMNKETLTLIANITSAQIARCFPKEMNGFRCVVCTKVLGGVRYGDNGLWKNGLHLHWPDLLVHVDTALELRECMKVGLEQVCDWSEHLGVRDPDWNDIIDEKVYRKNGRAERSGGLRMIGAPKATKCPNKHNLGVDCHMCKGLNNQHILDFNVYMPFFMIKLGEYIDLQKNNSHYYLLTTVRCCDGVSPTPGFQLYKGAPRPALPKEGKGKKGGEVPRSFTIIEDQDVCKVMRTLLIRQSPTYTTSKMEVFYDKKFNYRVKLTGDHSTFCFNKGDYHSHSNVYMEVFKLTTNKVISRMKCWSSRPINRLSGDHCSRFKGNSVFLKRDEQACLFDSGLMSQVQKGDTEGLQKKLTDQKRKYDSISEY